MRMLRLIMRHMLDQRLIGKLLRAVGNVLSGVSGRGGYDGWPCRGGWVHHGALMMLVLSLLGHIWYFTCSICLGLVHRHGRHRYWV